MNNIKYRNSFSQIGLSASFSLQFLQNNMTISIFFSNKKHDLFSIRFIFTKFTIFQTSTNINTSLNFSATMVMQLHVSAKNNESYSILYDKQCHKQYQFFSLRKKTALSSYQTDQCIKRSLIYTE